MKFSTDNTRRTVGLTLILLFSVNAGAMAVQLCQRAERSAVAPPGLSRTHRKQFSVKYDADNSRRVSSSPSIENDPTARARMSEAYGELPLTFEAHERHAGEWIKFTARAPGYDLFLTPNEAVLALRRDDGGRMKDGEKASAASLNPRLASLGRAVLRMKFAGADPRPRVSGAEELPGKVNYFIGNDPAKWRAGVATYAKVRYESVYPGVDVIYYGNRRQLEYDFVLAPGAAYRNISLAFEGVRSMKIDARGDLVLRMAGGVEVRQQKPSAYQEVGGQRREISSRYVLKGKRRVGFRVGDYDRTRPLVIDPVLVYSTYLGGSGNDVAESIAVDSSGNAYVTGITGSANFPVANAVQPTGSTFSTNPVMDVFVTKLNATGTALVYSTYLGGTGDDQGHGIAVDPSGNVYLVGETGSQDVPSTPQNEGFPTVNAVRPNRGSGRKAFVSKLNAAGSALIYSTYLGGEGGTDIGVAIAADSAGNAYVTGRTNTPNFPTANAFQPMLASPPVNCGIFGCGYTNDAFVVKFDPTGSFVYSTYFGSAEDDGGVGITADSSGNAYVTGSGMPPTTPGAFQASGQGFIAKFNENGSQLLYSARGIRGVALAVDYAGNVYVTGATFSTSFPPTTEGAFDRQCGTDGNCNPSPEGMRRSDAYLTKLNAAGTALVYSTYLGGSNNDAGQGIAVDASGNAYVTGYTGSSDFPLLNSTQGYGGGDCGGFVRAPCLDAFVTKLNPAGSALVYSTLLGGDHQDSGGNSSSGGGNGIAVDGSGNAYVTGRAGSTNFPTTPGAFQTTIGGGDCFGTPCGDAFIAKIADRPPHPVDETDFFVRQHYADFFSRAPDASGLAFWTNNISVCGSNTQCTEVKRIDTSAAFYLSVEFQQTGYLVYRIYKATFPASAQRPRGLPRFDEFLPDTRQIGQGVIVNEGDWEARLESNKTAYAVQFVERSQFIAQHPPGTPPSQFVDALNLNTGNSLSPSERDALVAELTANNTTQGRAAVLRKVAEHAEFTRREFNSAFVLTQYFGYLRRNPNDAPDNNFNGYDFWLAKLNQFNGDFRTAEMVKAFITSGEYRARFGQL